ncbi:cytochrome-c peroxidase [Halothiobacillus sp.]|uniref:cytochrome-c peroxidase n=1 Tax=Halothiobacillus sp. TaxID=1891311 RepID=UPI002AD48AFA|nr:cytochrome c peroxidase [Halothiobacillus sp.]
MNPLRAVSRHPRLSLILFASLAASGVTLAHANQITQWLDIQYEMATGENPQPIQLVRPKTAPLSTMAELGKQIFFDKNLSGSGKQSCASCHSPQHAYGPPNGDSVMMGGPDLHSQGARAVPSIMYLERQPNFSIGPENATLENINLNQQATQAKTAAIAQKNAGNAASSTNLVPQGGLFWDGRVNTLQAQADGPLFNPVEMDGGTPTIVAAKLEQSAYAPVFKQLFGATIFGNPNQTVAEALFAVARYQIEDPSFHPYSSKYDAWLEGKTTLSHREMKGYFVFNDPRKGNCAACHLDQPTRDHRPPLFTDHQFEALGLPRNPAIEANQDPAYDDLGLCGPFRQDLKSQTRYCGMFLTPTLRNVATRRTFFHNGVYHTLKDVLNFYDFRDTEPAKIYPRGTDGRIEQFNDLPVTDRRNVDTVDAPFNRHLGEKPVLTTEDKADLIAFLKTLTDGYQAAR